MRIQLVKDRNKYSKNYYTIEIEVNSPLTQENYNSIIAGIEQISSVVDPLIDQELAKDEAKKLKELPKLA